MYKSIDEVPDVILESQRVTASEALRSYQLGQPAKTIRWKVYDQLFIGDLVTSTGIWLDFAEPEN